MVDFCPYELLQNTKSDIGACPKRYHEDSLREKYRGPDGDRYRSLWERDFYGFIEKLVLDLERKLRRGKDRIDVRPAELTATGGNTAIDELEERRTILDMQIKEKLAFIEQYGEEGELQKAQTLMEEVDVMRIEIEQILKQEMENPQFRLEKRMEVCQTCGAFLIVGDALKRIESHFEGRQHTGWARVRQALEEYRKTQSRSDRHREHGEVYDRRSSHEYRRRYDDRQRDRRDDYNRRDRSPRRR